jgi:hypothetical protein
MRIVDRIFGWLLIVGSSLHALGSIKAYRDIPLTLLWALSATFAGWLLAGLNLLRAGRPNDAALGWVSFAGCLGQLVLVISFGILIGNVFDFRVLVHFVIASVLAVMSLRVGLKMV